MVIGSHNSWSYLRPRKWWMRLIAFAARCQRVDIKTQYLKYGVRCFDLRVRFNDIGGPIIAHGVVEYGDMSKSIWDNMKWIDVKGDCYVRVIHEARTSYQYLGQELQGYNVDRFKLLAKVLEKTYPNTQFWCGRNLYDWKVDYQFEGEEPTCEETYGSVVPGKKWLYGWWPWLYAVTHNKAIKAQGTDKDILLIDYVDVG